VEFVSRDVFEPTVGFDVLHIVRIDIAADVITMDGVLKQSLWSCIAWSRDDPTSLGSCGDEVLAATADGGFMWEAEGHFMML
jgi:hypothetical protein